MVWIKLLVKNENETTVGVDGAVADSGNGGCLD